MYDEICKDINKRISAQIDSRCATDDEVRICWLITEVDRLRKIRDTSQKILQDDFFKLSQTPGRFRLWIIKKIFPEFSKFVAIVREYYWT